MISFVLLNYNSGEYVQALIDSLAAQTSDYWELVLVDNCSSDDSLQRIVARLEHHQLRKYRCVILSENVHFGAGMNAGLSSAQGAVVVPLNSDVYLHNSFVRALVEAMRTWSGKAGAFAGIEKVWDWDNGVLTDRIRSCGLSLVRRIDVGPWRQGVHPVKQLLGPAGSAPALVRAVLEDIRLPNGDIYDTRFVAYGEDIDLLLRMRLRGYECVYIPSLVLWHIGSASYGGGGIGFASKPASVVGRILANKWRIWRRIPSAAERLTAFPLVVGSDVYRLLLFLRLKGPRCFRDALRVYCRTLVAIAKEERLPYESSPWRRGLYSGWVFPRQR